MINVEFVVDTLDDLKTLEMWLYEIPYKFKFNSFDIFCHETNETYFYKVENVDGALTLVAGESTEDIIPACRKVVGTAAIKYYNILVNKFGKENVTMDPPYDVTKGDDVLYFVKVRNK